MPAGRVTPQQPESCDDHTDRVPLGATFARGPVRDLRVRRSRASAWMFAALNSVESVIQNLATLDLFHIGEARTAARRPMLVVAAPLTFGGSLPASSAMRSCIAMWI
jgi:hypothetical protein